MDLGLTSARRRVAVLTGVCLLALTAAFTLALGSSGRAASQPPAQPKPDLVVTSLIIQGLGHNPYLVVPQSGQVPDITVKVTTRNVGRAAAPESSTLVVLEGFRANDGSTFQSDFSLQHVHALAPGQSQTNTLTIKKVQPHLGPTHMRAVADWDNKVTESNGQNNERTSPMIPAIARTWDADSLTAKLIGGQGVTAENGEANIGLFFRFNHLDVGAGIFYYRVTGSVKENANYKIGPCSGQGADSVGHAPWSSNSFFGVSFGLDKYLGVVKASANQITVPITCEGHTSKVPVNMLDLRIGSGKPVGMYKYSTKIRDVAETTSVGATIDYLWLLKADVP
jgi:CARDB